MIRFIVAIFFGYIFILLETAWGNGLQVGMARIDFLVPLVAWYGFKTPLPEGLFLVLTLGILAEPFTVLPGGIQITVLVSAYLLIRYISGHIPGLRCWHKVPVVGFVAAESQILEMLLSGAAQYIWPWGVIQGGLAALIFPFLMLLLEFWEGLFSRFTARIRVGA